MISRLVLIFQILFAPLAQASAFSHAQTLAMVQSISLDSAPKAFQSLRKMNLPTKEINQALDRLTELHPAEMTVEAGRAVLFVLALAVLDAVAKEYGRRGLSPNPSDASYAMIVAQASERVVNNGAIYSALAGAGGTSVAANEVTKAFVTLIANPQTHAALIKSLCLSASLTAATYGFDLGAQLWVEARYQLEDKSDYELADSLFGVGMGALGDLFAGKSATDSRGLRVANLMYQNMLKVALFDSELRADWFSNAWRTRTMTGFAVLLTGGLIAAGVGVPLLSIGVPVAAAMFGTAVAVMIFIPAAVKDQITSSLHSVRQYAIQGLLNSNVYMIGQVGRRNPSVTPERERTRLEFVERIIQRRHVLRSNYLTIVFERARLGLQYLDSAGQATVAGEADKRRQLTQIFTDTQEFFRYEKQRLKEVQDLCDDKNDPILPILLKEQERVQSVADFFASLAEDFLAAVAELKTPARFQDLSDVGQAYAKFIEISYARGFIEDKVAEPMATTAN